MTTAPVVWFLTGSQGLYGPETVAQVEQQSQAIAAELDGAAELPGDVHGAGDVLAHHRGLDRRTGVPADGEDAVVAHQHRG